MKLSDFDMKNIISFLISRLIKINSANRMSTGDRLKSAIPGIDSKVLSQPSS